MLYKISVLSLYVKEFHNDLMGSLFAGGIATISPSRVRTDPVSSFNAEFVRKPECLWELCLTQQLEVT